MEEILTIEELSTKLKVSMGWVKRHARKLPHLDLGKEVRFELSRVIAHLRRIHIDNNVITPVDPNSTPNESDQLRMKSNEVDSAPIKVASHRFEGREVVFVKEKMAEVLPPKNIYINPPSPNPKRERNPLSPNGDIPQGKSKFSQDFETFWKAYPKRKCKGAAWRAWQKLRAQGVDLDEIISAINKQKTWNSWSDWQFIPYPATWLNANGWDDEEDPMARGPTEQSAADKFLENFNKRGGPGESRSVCEGDETARDSLREEVERGEV